MTRRSLLSRSALAGGALSFALLGLAIYSAAAQTPPPGAPGGAASGAADRPAAPAPGPRRDPLEGVDLSPKPPVAHLGPAQEQKLFQLQPGYAMTPVLTEPQIEQPGQIAFDADGRMYVLELRSYMLDVDAKDELKPISRISRWEDKDGDGVYETGTVFIDNLVFPRFVTPMGNGQLITKESNSNDTYLYTDTDGDGKADKKELFVTGLGRSGNVEHQESHLTWALDNWMYSTYNSVRVRWTPQGVIKEPTGVNGGAWGAGQDNYGKMWFTIGASGLPTSFQFPIHYGSIDNPDSMEKGFNVPWGAPIGVGDMQGGLGAVRPNEGSLNATTAGAGANIYRGDRLPAELIGDFFYGEVVGRILRRAKPVDQEGLTQVRNPYQAEKSEFIRSMDPLFRPVDNRTAPDGTIYVVDMYHGIIQQGEWTVPGSYLRAKIKQYNLDSAVRMGRIWRLTYQGMPRDTTRPRMFEETSAQLVQHLTHPNGWWRDTAQQQLVLRQDKSVVPALKAMAAANSSQLGRIHAAWTLEGLNALDAATVRLFLRDADPKIRAQGLRLGETLYKAGDQSFAEDYKRLATDSDTSVAIQALLSLNYLKVTDAVSAAKSAQAANPAKGVTLVANRIINPAPDNSPLFFSGDNPAYRTDEEVARLQRGAQIFADSCGECHGRDALGAPDGGGGLMAPALAGNLRVQGSPEHVLRVLLHGLTDPINGHSYAAGTMVPQSRESDEWIASVASYLRNGLTNGANMVTPDMVAWMRKVDATRTTPYTDPELTRAEPHALKPTDAWKLTASHSAPVNVGGTAHAAGALTLEGWTTGEPQKPGMWYQLELPKAVNLAGVEYQALASNAFARGKPRTVYSPRGFKLEVSRDGKTWATVKEGQSVTQFNSLIFAPVVAKYVRITTTAPATSDEPWGMRYLTLFAKG